MRSRAARRRAWTAALLALVAAAGTGHGLADPVLDLQSTAVTVQHMPAQSWAGYGIYLGDGLIITAAHVAGHGLLAAPRVLVAGQPVQIDTVKIGSYPDNDLAVLRIVPPVPVALAPRRTTVCTTPPQPGEPVLVVTPEKVTGSTVIAPEALPPEMRSKYAASIKDVYTTGNSGSGVFDAASRCLLGIMSSKIEGRQTILVNGAPTARTVGIAKHFVPASDIKEFLRDLPPS